MEIIKEGHLYKLADFDGGISQELSFIEKDASGTLTSGTTNEEVLAMLIDRIQFLQGKFPCRENAIVITKLEESLMWLNKRTQDRKVRGVEGKQEA